MTKRVINRTRLTTLWGPHIRWIVRCKYVNRYGEALDPCIKGHPNTLPPGTYNVRLVASVKDHGRKIIYETYMIEGELPNPNP